MLNRVAQNFNCFFFSLIRKYENLTSLRKTYQRSLAIINGRSQSDKFGEFTFISSQGRSTVDLVCCSIADLNFTSDLKVMNDVPFSDHFPIRLFIDIAAFTASQQAKPSRKAVKNDYKLIWKTDRAL